MSTGHRARRLATRALLIGAATLAVLAPSTVAHAEPSLPEIEAQLDKSHDELEATIEKWNGVNIDLQATQAKVAELQNKLKPLEDGVASANANVEQIAVAAFKSSGNLRSLSIVLNAESSGSMVDQLSMLQQISHTQQRNIDDLKAARSKYDDEKKTLDETLAAQSTQKADIENQRKKIEGDVKKLEELQRKANNAGSTKATKNSTPPPNLPAPSGKAAAAVEFAKKQVDKPYKYGAAGPGSYDCSGLTMAAWGAAGVSLYHQASRQFSDIKAHYKTSSPPWDQMQPGDLIFFSGLGHVGLYVGNKTMIHAPHTGSYVQYAPATRSGIYGWARPQ